MQYKSGTVNLTNGLSVVAGNGTAFRGNVQVGDSFKVSGEKAIYQVIAVDPVLQQIQIAPDYAGLTQSGASFQICRDRTPTLGLAEINPGDEDWPYWMTNEVIRRLDAIMANAKGIEFVSGSFSDAGGSGKRCKIGVRYLGVDDNGQDSWQIEPVTSGLNEISASELVTSDAGGSNKKCRIVPRHVGVDDNGQDIWNLEATTI